MSTRAAVLPRPTSAGWAVAVGAVALAVAGVVLGYEALTVLAAGAGVALALGLVVSLGMPKLTVDREIEPARVERGRPALGLVSVHNTGRLRSRPCTAVERMPAGELRLAIPSLGRGQSTSVPYQLPTERRGALEVGPFALTLGDPLGLWQAERVVGDTKTLFVKPRVYGINPRPAGRTQHLEGPTSDTAPRGTLTFHALREYVLGDDIRRVHWKTTARTGTLMVREHVDTSQPSTVVVLDTRAAVYSPELFEEAVDVAASVVQASEQRGFPVRFVTTGGQTLIVRSGHHGNELDDVLSGVQLDDEGTMARGAVSATAGNDRDVVIVIAGAVSAADLAQVTHMTRRFGHKALVTIRAARIGDGGDGRAEAADRLTARWTGGAHLDGETAGRAVAAWTSAAHRRGQR